MPFHRCSGSVSIRSLLRPSCALSGEGRVWTSRRTQSLQRASTSRWDSRLSDLWLQPDTTLLTSPSPVFQVRCLKDHGEFEIDDGTVILLKKNSQVRRTFTRVQGRFQSFRGSWLGLCELVNLQGKKIKILRENLRILIYKLELLKLRNLGENWGIVNSSF